MRNARVVILLLFHYFSLLFHYLFTTFPLLFHYSSRWMYLPVCFGIVCNCFPEPCWAPESQNNWVHRKRPIIIKTASLLADDLTDPGHLKFSIFQIVLRHFQMFFFLIWVSRVPKDKNRKIEIFRASGSVRSSADQTEKLIGTIDFGLLVGRHVHAFLKS